MAELIPFPRKRTLGPPEITVFACPPRCQHVFEGEARLTRADHFEEGDGYYSQVCSKCGVSALDVAMMEGM